jgi:hypothetical protein
MKIITIDIDKPFGEFGQDTMTQMIDSIPWVTARWFRRSSGGNIHIKLMGETDISLFDSLCIRAYLGDDPKRIACDLRRYYHTKEESKTGRCFDEKYIDGVLFMAGGWTTF